MDKNQEITRLMRKLEKVAALTADKKTINEMEENRQFWAGYALALEEEIKHYKGDE